MSPSPTQEPEGQPPAILPPMMKISILFPAVSARLSQLTGQSVVAVLANEVLATALIVLCLVKRAVDLRIEQECFESYPVPAGLQLHSIRRQKNTVDWKHDLSSDWGSGYQSGNEDKTLCQ